MHFDKASNIASLLAKGFARDFLRLLVTHRNISASEAASRLDLHIQTAQDFLERLYNEKIVIREEVTEGKRPYFRYELVKRDIKIDLDLNSLVDRGYEHSLKNHLIRERKNSGAIFNTPASQDYITSLIVFMGKGRNRKERKINLTRPQGRFLFHLPFPGSDHARIIDIVKKAELAESSLPEILDLVKDLVNFGVIEKKK
ncbi:MAG: hypothetical protein JSV24_00145 [Bacteroidales bacterium]|nr:MAG: hypothetical protein JSV24_00145 [Bacteroidales bacterium]